MTTSKVAPAAMPTLAELEQELAETLLELEGLKQRVREAQDLRELQFLVGPSDAENAEAKSRITALDQLDALCAWGKHEFELSNAERSARSRHNRIMAAQSDYENKYC